MNRLARLFMNPVKKVPLMIFIISTSILLITGQTFSEAKDQYDQKNYAEALPMFLEFAENHPDSSKWDNALYYAGKIELKQDRPEAAAEHFLQVIQRQAEEHRIIGHYKLSLINLSRVYNSFGTYSEVIRLIEMVPDLDEPKKNNTALMAELAEAYYQQARLYKEDNEFESAEQYFLTGLALYESLENSATDEPADLLDIVIGKARTFKHLFQIAQSNESNGLDETALYHQGMAELEKAAELDTEGKKTKTLGLIRDAFQADPSAQTAPSRDNESGFSWGIEAELHGGGAFLASRYGGTADIEGELTWDLPNRNRIQIQGAYQFTNFAKKTFNYPSETIKDKETRIYQLMHSINGDVSWRTGSLSRIYNKLEFSAASAFAEETEDNSIKIQLNDRISWSPVDFLRLTLQGKAGFTAFPNYYVSGRKIDSLTAEVSPQIRFSVLPNLTLNFGYTYQFKHYIDARYDTQVYGISSDSTRQYMTHSGSASLGFRAGSIWRAKLTYQPKYQTSQNYDIWVSYSNADREFVSNYNDHLSHQIKLTNSFTFGDSFHLKLNGSAAFINYLNYPARNSQKEKLGELRSDIKIGVDLTAEYAFNRFIGIQLSADWEKQISNMKYNYSYATNYDYLSVTTGVRLSY